MQVYLKFWEHTRKLDAIRGHKFEDYCPEMYEMLKEYENETHPRLDKLEIVEDAKQIGTRSDPRLRITKTLSFIGRCPETMGLQFRKMVKKMGFF